MPNKKINKALMRESLEMGFRVFSDVWYTFGTP